MVERSSEREAIVLKYDSSEVWYKLESYLKLTEDALTVILQCTEFKEKREE